MEGKKVAGKCPICLSKLKVTELTCPECKTRISGEFDTCDFCKLTVEQYEFIKVFIKARGNIKEVEKELKISYPTVRNKLEDVIMALNLEEKIVDKRKRAIREKILRDLEAGIISPKEAVELLKD